VNSFKIGLYDPNHYASECHGIIEAINHTALQILKRISKMKLQKLEFSAGRETARISDIMSIIQHNVDKLDINISPITDWAPQLQCFQRLQGLEVARVQPRNVQAETTFWTAVSQLPNLKIIEADTIPIPPRLELCFPHVIDLGLYFLIDMDYGELSRSVVTFSSRCLALKS